MRIDKETTESLLVFVDSWLEQQPLPRYKLIGQLAKWVEQDLGRAWSHWDVLFVIDALIGLGPKIEDITKTQVNIYEPIRPILDRTEMPRMTEYLWQAPKAVLDIVRISLTKIDRPRVYVADHSGTTAVHAVNLADKITLDIPKPYINAIAQTIEAWTLRVDASGKLRSRKKPGPVDVEDLSEAVRRAHEGEYRWGSTFRTYLEVTDR